MFTVGKLAKKHGLSRSTLLYYDRMGLLSPSARSDADYRVYSAADEKRLEQICLYRRAGLSLKDIKRILDTPETDLASVLEDRLRDLNEDIGRLRRQQQFILGILKSRQAEKQIGVMNRDTWVALLIAAGFSEEDMVRWHQDFERHSPDKHQQFLEFLCIPADEIDMLRAVARDGNHSLSQKKEK